MSREGNRLPADKTSAPDRPSLPAGSKRPALPGPGWDRPPPGSCRNCPEAYPLHHAPTDCFGASLFRCILSHPFQSILSHPFQCIRSQLFQSILSHPFQCIRSHLGASPHTLSSACSISLMISRAFSTPTERLTRFSPMPIPARWAVRWSEEEYVALYFLEG